VNNNINQLGTDIRKAVTGETPESVIASKIAREAKPLIDQAQFIQDQLENAKAEATRISTENKDMFDIQMADRADKRNLAFKLYDTINADEIRQEDIQREEENYARDVRRADFEYQRAIDRWDVEYARQLDDERKKLEDDRNYNLTVGLAQLWVDPRWLTSEELVAEYARASKSALDEQKAWKWQYDPNTDSWINETTRQILPASDEWEQATWELVSVNTGNKNVQVDSVASGWLQNAIEQMKSQWMPVVTWQAYRGQEATIKAMWDRVGMPWATAAELRAKWHQIADVWSSKHEGGMAIDLYGWTDKNGKLLPPTQQQIQIMEANGWRWWNIPWDAGHFEYVWTGKQGDSELTLSDISTFNNSTYKPQSEKNKAKKAKYQQFLQIKNKVFSQKDADINDVMAYSMGGKDLTDTDSKTFTKFTQALDQVDWIQKQIKKMDTWPILWRIKALNPYDTDAQVLSASLNALIPNLARWVYWEVGVLTDNDIRQYAKTIPNLTQTADVNNAVLAMTLDTIAGGYKRQLQTLAASGKDVSGFAGIYESIKAQADSLRASIPWFNDVQMPEIDDDEIESIRSNLNAPKTAYDLLPSTKFSNLY